MHPASPLVHVMMQPSLVMSHLHMPIIMLQLQTIMPFIMQQQLHMVPARELHRFCSVVAAIWSSQMQVIFMPPVHFSIFMVQRGIMATFIGIMVCAGMLGVIMPGMLMVVGFITVFIMTFDSLQERISPPDGPSRGPSTAGRA